MPHEPRYANGARRRALRQRLKAEGRPCWICVVMGRSANAARIRYDLKFPHPYSFEMDELVPVSKYWLGGYPSAQACALDYDNLAATHRCCNQWRSNKTVDEVLAIARDLKAGKKPKGRPAPRVIGEHHTSRDWRHFRPKNKR